MRKAMTQATRKEHIYIYIYIYMRNVMAQETHKEKLHAQSYDLINA